MNKTIYILFKVNYIQSASELISIHNDIETSRKIRDEKNNAALEEFGEECPFCYQVEAFEVI